MGKIFKALDGSVFHVGDLFDFRFPDVDTPVTGEICMDSFGSFYLSFPDDSVALCVIVPFSDLHILSDGESDMDSNTSRLYLSFPDGRLFFSGLYLVDDNDGPAESSAPCEGDLRVRVEELECELQQYRALVADIGELIKDFDCFCFLTGCNVSSKISGIISGYVS